MIALAACGGSDSPGYDGPISAFCMAARPQASGDGTYYDADGTGNCSFDAIAERLHGRRDERARLRARRGAARASRSPARRARSPCASSISARAARTAISISARRRSTKIAPLSAGRVPITWHEVACNVTGPIDYHFKDGSNPYWTAIQIRNHRYPIAKLEAMTPSGAYKTIGRLDYNYFVDDRGLGPGRTRCASPTRAATSSRTRTSRSVMPWSGKGQRSSRPARSAP